MGTTPRNRIPTSFMPADEQATRIEWQCHTAWLDDEGWKYAAPMPHPYRVAMAKVLVALAARLAPTGTIPNASTAPLAR